MVGWYFVNWEMRVYEKGILVMRLMKIPLLPGQIRDAQLLLRTVFDRHPEQQSVERDLQKKLILFYRNQDHYLP